MQLFNAKGLPLHETLADLYGGVVKVHGFFGVCSHLFFDCRFLTTYRVQDEQLYVSDPQALQSIIFKDQEAFEETAVFTE
jgi:hypothetical protein